MKLSFLLLLLAVSTCASNNRKDGDSQNTEAKVDNNKNLNDQDEEDQETGDTMISFNYLDKSGNLKSIRGNANRLLLRRKKPQIGSHEEKNRGELVRQIIRKKQKKNHISMQGDSFVDYMYDEYDDYNAYEDYQDYSADFMDYAELSRFRSRAKKIDPKDYKIQPHHQQSIGFYHSKPTHSKPQYGYGENPSSEHYFPTNQYLEEIYPNVFIEKNHPHDLKSKVISKEYVHQQQYDPYADRQKSYQQTPKQESNRYSDIIYNSKYHYDLYHAQPGNYRHTANHAPTTPPSFYHFDSPPYSQPTPTDASLSVHHDPHPYHTSPSSHVGHEYDHPPTYPPVPQLTHNSPLYNPVQYHKPPSNQNSYPFIKQKALPKHENPLLYQKSEPAYYKLVPVYDDISSTGHLKDNLLLPSTPSSPPPTVHPSESRSLPPTFATLLADSKPSVSPLIVPTPHAAPRIDGRAYGADLVGNFDHHTGSLGPFGFYANYYDEK